MTQWKTKILENNFYFSMAYISIVLITYAATMKLGMFSFCKVYTLPHSCFVDAYTIKANPKRFHHDRLARLRVFKSAMGLLCISRNF